MMKLCGFSFNKRQHRMLCFMLFLYVLTVDPQNGALPANDDSLAPLRNLLLLEGGTLAQS